MNERRPPSSQPPLPPAAGEEPTESEVLAILAPVARKIADAMGPPGAGRSQVLQVLRSDQGAVELLSAAFDSGREDAARVAIMSGKVPGAVPTAAVDHGAPDWSDVLNEGERRVLSVEQSICGSCRLAHVCRYRAPLEMLVVVSRCVAFEPRPE